MLDGWFRILAGSYGGLGLVLCNQDLQFHSLYWNHATSSPSFGGRGVGQRVKRSVYSWWNWTCFHPSLGMKLILKTMNPEEGLVI
jgi:hypothetical protein